jgi:hypothetical protein
MKWLRVLPVVLLVLVSAATVNADGGPVTKVYGDYALPTGAGYQMETWNLNKGPVAVTYTLDLSGAPNVAYSGNYGFAGQVGLIWWDGGPAVAGALMSGFLADGDNSGTEFPTYPDIDGTQDLDDKFNLQRFPNPGSWSETQYDVTFNPTTVYASPIGSWDNYGIWFDRDGVDQWQDDAWGAVDGGTYNTGGIYKVQLTFTKLNATTGVVQPLFFPELLNDDAPGGYGVPTGFNRLSGGGYEYFPAGISFQTDEIKMAAMRVLVQGNAGNGTIEIRDLEVTGYPSDTPVTTNVAADPNPVAINGSVQVSAVVESKTDVPVGFADYSLDGGTTWHTLGTPWLPNDGILEISGTITAPATAGIYDLCVRGVDNYWNWGEPTCIMLVVYDPDGGFATGGGYIESPVDSDYEYMQVGGRATFGFVSKYKKGASVPDGNTEFQFKAGDLNFHSTSYQWLVVNQGGTRAQFKGYGTINGSGNYGFMIWAGDGDPDTFRIKIWTETDGVENVVYDNGSDQAIGGGNIVVHAS